MGTDGTGRSGKIHYAWFILVACLGFYSLTIGIFASTQGVFYAPVMQETGWSRTQTTLFASIQPLVSAICSIPAGKILEKYDPRIVLSVCTVAFGAAYIAPALVNTLWMWDLYGAVYGAVAAFVIYLAVPMLVNRWFVKRNGFAIGLASASISVFAAIGNPVVQQLIAVYGWETARLQVGIVITVVAVALTAIFVRRDPESMGMRPYGAEEPAEGQGATADAKDGAEPSKDNVEKPQIQLQGATLSQARKSPALYMIMLTASAFVTCTMLGQQLASYGADSAIGAAAGALSVSIFSGVAIFSKIGLGWLCDRVGVSKAAVLACACGVIGPLTMMVSGANTAVFFLGAGIYGIGYSSLTVLNPISVREAFGLRDYSRILARVTTVLFFMSAVGNLLFAVIYDVTGSYAGMFIMSAALYGISIFVLPLAVRNGRKMWAAK